MIAPENPEAEGKPVAAFSVVVNVSGAGRVSVALTGDDKALLENPAAAVVAAHLSKVVRDIVKRGTAR